jgi:hypothetical protein
MRVALNGVSKPSDQFPRINGSGRRLDRTPTPAEHGIIWKIRSLFERRQSNGSPYDTRVAPLKIEGNVFVDRAYVAAANNATFAKVSRP